MNLTYLDHNATTAPLPEVVQAMQEAYAHYWANPSSVHRLGQQAKQRMELARQQVANLLHATPREILFTSGGTEANNLALAGVLLPAHRRQPGSATLITTAVEHAAVRQPAEALQKAGVPTHLLKVDQQGQIDLDSLNEAIAAHQAEHHTLLISLAWANNETGVIQPIEAIADAITQARQQYPRCRFFLHWDATQAVGKLPVDVAQAKADLLTCSAHKFHGPKGVGALYIQRRDRLQPQQLGGAQELDRRGGTENTPGIVGMGLAAEHAQAFLADVSQRQAIEALRNTFEQAVVEQLPDTVIHGQDAPRLWNTTNLGFPSLEAEAILLGLSEQGVCASAGAACSSGSLEPSPVLLAMGVPEPVAHGSVRFSLSRFTAQQNIEHALEVLPRVVQRLGKVLPQGR